jgi:iron complex outermembrane receptor protein
MHTILMAVSAAAIATLCAAQAWGQTVSSERDSDLETIVVIGKEAALEAERAEINATPGGASLIDMQSVREQNVSNLADALRLVPGVWAVSPTGDENVFFSSRGSNLDATDYDMNGIKLLQDGLPVTTADGNNHNRIIDPLAAQYATMARGANALSYGASTLGGAVNFVTPTGRDNQGIGLSVTGGSHGQMVARLSYGTLFGDSADGLVSIEARQWDGYREHNEQERTGLYANAGWQFGDDWSTRFYLTAIDNNQELAGALSRAQFDADPDRAGGAAIPGNYQIDVDTARLANRTSWQVDANRRLDFGFSVEDQSLHHPIVWSPFFSLLIGTDHRDLGTMLRYSQKAGNHEFLFGLNYGQNEVDGGHYRNLAGERNGLMTVIDNRAATAEIFAMDSWHVTDSTTLVLAAQAVSADREVRNRSAASGVVAKPKDSYERINPRFGVVQSVGDGVSLYGNLSSLFEPPTNYELEDNVAGGDATLRPMKGSVIEVGTRGERAVGTANRWAWDVSIYYAEIDDEILSVEDASAPGTSLATNVDRTVHAGIEAMLRSDISLGVGRGALEPLLTLTVNEFSFDGDRVYGDNDLPAAPEYFLRGELLYRGASGFFIGPTIERAGKRWADFENSYRIGAHTLFGLRAGWTGERWRAFADIRNLSDETYVAYHSVRNSASPDDAILYAGEPLSAYFGIEILFD